MLSNASNDLSNASNDLSNVPNIAIEFWNKWPAIEILSSTSLVPRLSATTPRRKIREGKKEGGSGK